MKLGTLVQFKAYNTVLDIGYVSKYDNNNPNWVYVEFSEKRYPKGQLDSTMMEVISEAR